MKTMSDQQAQDNFNDVLGTVNSTNEPVVVEKNGRPLVVMISPEMYEQMETLQKQRWERAWQAVDKIRLRNADRDPDVVLAEVTKVVEEVRQQRYGDTGNSRLN